MKWFFRTQSPGEITRDPIVGEFFSTEAIDNPAQALVREGIQNALDAKVGQEISISIFLGKSSGATEIIKKSKWFDGNWEHVNANGNGLRDVPKKEDPCTYLVFEDFGTTGLLGDIKQPFDEPKNKNSFFYFFRAEGRTGKSEGDRGRWGVGKHVFPRSSRISSYFGFTIRSDDGKCLLMGHTILKSHKINENNYAPDGYFGEQYEENDLILPVSNEKTLDDFRKEFRLSRNNEPGLSIVVPYVDPDITPEHIKQAVVSEYFFPILKSELTVEIKTPNDKLTIDARNLLQIASSLSESSNDNLPSIIELADWSAFRSLGKEYVINPCIMEIPTWSDELIPENLFDAMREDFDAGRNLAIHAGIKVQEKGQPSKMSYFNAYIRQDGYKKGRPLFIREGIIISDIYGRGFSGISSPGVRSMVIVEDKPLATLLGDSENPAHTQWQKDSSNFKNKYVNGKYYIEFVTRFVSNVVNALGAKEKQKDPYLFASFFSLPLDKLGEQSPESVLSTPSTDGKKSKKDIFDVKGRQRLFQIIKIKGGFKIIPGDVKFTSSFRLNISTAYDLRRGNPTTKYMPSDFILDKPPIKYKDLRGVKIVAVEKNQISIDVTNSDFQMIVAGFDDKRDLFIKAQPEEVEND
jgi:hypothetical protein